MISGARAGGDNRQRGSGYGARPFREAVCTTNGDRSEKGACGNFILCLRRRLSPCRGFMNARVRDIVRVSIVGIVGNVLLALAKIIIGFVVHSVAFISDGLNNTTDALSSVVTIIGTKIAAHGADKEHPYGHGRVEYIASMAVALIIVSTGIASLYDAVKKIFSPEKTDYDLLAVIIIVAAVVVKLLLGSYFRRRGKQLHSDALTASGTDAGMDALASSVILVSIALDWIFHINVDAWLGAAIDILIIKAGYDILKDSLDDLIGRRVSPQTAEKIIHDVESFPQVEGAYDLILNQYGPERTIGSVHIQVPDAMDASQIDDLSRLIQEKIYKEFSIILTIGIYASNTSDPQAAAMRKALQKIVAHHPEIVQLHGFHVDKARHMITFDIIVDWEAANRADSIREEVMQEMQKLYPSFQVHTVVDEDYSG